MIMASDNLLAYPELKKELKIHIDTSKFQLGAVIGQKCKPIAFYSRQLTYDQKWYTLTNRELFRIVENLKEFRTILIGQRLRIYTHH